MWQGLIEVDLRRLELLTSTMQMLVYPVRAHPRPYFAVFLCLHAYFVPDPSYPIRRNPAGLVVIVVVRGVPSKAKGSGDALRRLLNKDLSRYGGPGAEVQVRFDIEAVVGTARFREEEVRDTRHNALKLELGGQSDVAVSTVGHVMQPHKRGHVGAVNDHPLEEGFLLGVF
jgi:hypothetical protein